MEFKLGKPQNSVPDLLIRPVRSTLMLAGLLLGAAIAVPVSPANASSALWDKYGFTVTIHGVPTRYNPFDTNSIDWYTASEVDENGISEFGKEVTELDMEADILLDSQKKLEEKLVGVDNDYRKISITSLAVSNKWLEILEEVKKLNRRFDFGYNTKAKEKQAEAAIEAATKEAERLRLKFTELDKQTARLKKEMDRLKAEISKTENQYNDVTYKAEMIRSQLEKAGKNQIMTGSPPDANFLYRLGNMNWWVNTDLRHIDESGGARLIKGTLGGVMTGGDMKLGDNSGIGFGIGYGHSSLTQTDPFGGAEIDSSGLNLMTRGYWGPNSNLLFDASLSYGFARFENVRPTFSDKYSTHAFGISFGANAARDFSPLWRGEARLGWSGSHSIRKASTDTSGFYNNRLTSNFGKATLSGRLMRKFEGGNGHVFADATLNAVTNDDSPANYDEQPFDAEIGAGFRVKLGGAAVLTGRGFIASLGRKNRDEYGGSLKISFNF